MRRYANSKIQEVVTDHMTPNLAWDQHHDCLVVDFCQNLALPNLVADQPGETYYFSPLGVYCFSVADVSLSDQAYLNAFVFHEGKGKKGGNTISSLLYKHLKDAGLIDKTKGTCKELTIIMDNCGGQNKNRMVLCLALLLVELNLWKRVNCLFLVAGHTKNACD